MKSVLGRWNHQFGLLRFGVAVLPIIGSHTNKLRIVWPPIGSTFVFGAYFVAVLAWLSSRAALRFKTKQNAQRGMYCGIAVSALALLGYGYLLANYVVEVETPSNGAQYRTIGMRRTPAADRLAEHLPNLSDERLLEIGGLTDAAIKEMWTPRSVDLVRWLLFTAVACIWSSLDFTAGAFARTTPFLKEH